MSPWKFYLFLCYSVLHVTFTSSQGYLPLVTQNPEVKSSFSSSDNPYSHRLTLDPKGRFILEWLVDFPTERVFFNVTVATNGYVGFGFSKKGEMAGSDLIIGGVDKNGQPYFTDRHALGDVLPVLDQSQDWVLHEAWERGALTFLSFSRPFDTCDTREDIPITDDLLTLIWAYSERDDELEFHFQNRGAYHVYLLDPDLTPEGLNDPYRQSLDNATGSSSVFSMKQERTLPVNDTLYWCSFHKVPTTQKNHIIGFNTAFPSDRDRKMVHHLLVYRCHGDQDTPESQILEQSEANGGGECYQGTSVGPPATSLCRELIHGWGAGGRAVFFPDHVGIPMSENGTEFFMLQVHYDNPNMVSNTSVNVSVDAYYTPNVRENDAGLIMFGANVPGAANLLIPPSTLNHVIFGQCAPSCTNYLLPKEGINVFAAALHTHTTGKEAKLHQYRDGREHPWILSDDNYNFDFQQVRVLRVERKIYPGDQMVMRCVYDTTLRNGSVVTGGFSTRHEMCLGLVYYYRRIPGVISCLSEIRRDSYMDLIGITNTTFDAEKRDEVITEPSQRAGLTVTEHATNNIEWHLGLREEIQRQQKYQVHTSICPNTLAIRAAQSAGNGSSSNSNDTAEAATSNVEDGSRTRRGNSEEGRFRNNAVERPLRRYTGDRVVIVGQPPIGPNAIVISVNERGVERKLYENEVVFPREIPPYTRPPQCRLDFGLPRPPFGFF
ncbi:unnamed protein product [Orchesella dallaii]|uniref:DOMON domain-containing protein n=1 Tax=Orchesella dallaii TaxID=48710 RepID=A0ABP1PHP4_9HEXA